MNATIQKWGNSLAVRIPKAVARQIHVAEGDAVTLHVDAETLNIRPARPRYRLDEGQLAHYVHRRPRGGLRQDLLDLLRIAPARVDRLDLDLGILLLPIGQEAGVEVLLDVAGQLLLPHQRRLRLADGIRRRLAAPRPARARATRRQCRGA